MHRWREEGESARNAARVEECERETAGDERRAPFIGARGERVQRISKRASSLHTSNCTEYLTTLVNT